MRQQLEIANDTKIKEIATRETQFKTNNTCQQCTFVQATRSHRVLETAGSGSDYSTDDRTAPSLRSTTALCCFIPFPWLYSTLTGFRVTTPTIVNEHLT